MKGIRTIQIWINKLTRWLGYLRREIFFNALRLRYLWFIQYLVARKRAKRDAEWEKLQMTRDSVVFRLGRCEKLVLYTDDKLSEYIYRREFECDEQTLIRNYLRPGDFFVDIGANLGLFTVIAARSVGSKGKVYAFEPTSLTYRRLANNIRVNHLNNVHCYQMALSDKEETRVLVISMDGYAACNSLAHPTAGRSFGKERVQCTSWDSFASENCLIGKVTLMKIDVEGWELHVLNGGARTFTRIDAPDLLVEFADATAEAAGTCCADLYQYLGYLGYEMYTFDTERGMLCRAVLKESYPYENLLATKSIAATSRRLRYCVADLMPER